MKIEKISENQIRCTLNTRDLNARHLTLMELAYGNEKARGLFREMIERADEEVGFQTDDMPLMVEAIPLSSDSIMLIITKVDDLDELDTRFARFSLGSEDDASLIGTPATAPFTGSAGDILETLTNLLETCKDEGNPEPANLTSVFRFSDLDTVLKTASVLKGVLLGNNSLYRCDSDHSFYLTLHSAGQNPIDYNKVCNILTEYAERVMSTPASEAYYREHFTLMVEGSALQKLA